MVGNLGKLKVCPRIGAFIMTFPFRFHIFSPRVRFQSKRFQPNKEKLQNFSYLPTLDYRKFGEKDSLVACSRPWVV
jgi:hypothetical protein